MRVKLNVLVALVWELGCDGSAQEPAHISGETCESCGMTLIDPIQSGFER